jgi:hypothetical protein
MIKVNQKQPHKMQQAPQKQIRLKSYERKININIRPTTLRSSLTININTTILHDGCGRFGNQFFRNMVAHFVCEKSHIKFTYGYNTWFNQLGITFFEAGSANLYPNDRQGFTIPENQVMHYITSAAPLKRNLNFNASVFYQDPKFCQYLRHYFEEPSRREKIRKSCCILEASTSSVKKNNDIFVQVRLGDTAKWSPGLEYYELAITRAGAAAGTGTSACAAGTSAGAAGTGTSAAAYIASDSITHPLCQTLIKKYKLTVVNANEVDTLKLAATCKHLILSHGTFSWLMGFLNMLIHDDHDDHHANIIYPDYDKRMRVKWHPNIYVFPEWNKL